jgi:uncharacterized protein YndB with AHSA1/START domain
VRAKAERELLAPREDVWAFLAEPHHLADWWPGVAAVAPDRRRLAPGARWEVRRGATPGLFSRANSVETLVVREVDQPRSLTWHLTGQRLDVRIELVVAELDRTIVRLEISGPFVLGFNRSLPRTALARLHGLIQTAASL